MAASLVVNEGRGAFGQVESWSITDEATPIVLDEGADVGSLTFATGSVSRSKFLDRNQIELDTELYGSWVGDIDSIDDDLLRVSGTAASILGKCSIDVVAPPIFNGQHLSDAWNTYISLGYDTTPAIDYQSSIDPVVVFCGWSGNLWQYLQNLAVAYKQEISTSNGTIIIRDRGGRKIDITNLVGDTMKRSVNSQALGKYVDITYQIPTESNDIGSTRFNFSPNPSFENANAATAIGSWTVTVGTIGSGTGATTPTYTFAQSTGNPASGTKSGRLLHTNTTVGDYFRMPAPPYTVSGGGGSIRIAQLMDVSSTQETLFSFSMAVAASAAAGSTTRPMDYTVSYRWYNAAMVYLGGGDSYNEVYRPSSGSRSDKRVISFPNLIRPTGAVYFEISIGQDNWSHRNDGMRTNDALYLDAVMLTNGPPTAYFDGNTGGAVWVGAVNNSISSKLVSPGNAVFYDALADNNNLITVNAADSVSLNIPVKGSPTFVNQPVYTNTFPIAPGQYLVSGNDGVPITPQYWAAYGGSLSVEVGDDGASIDIVLVGPRVELPSAPGPYTMSIGGGNVNQFATFSVVALGVKSTPVTLHLRTAASSDDTQEETAAQVQSPFVTSDGQARSLGSDLCGQHSGSNVTLSFTISMALAKGFGITPGMIFTYDNGVYRIDTTEVDGVNVSCTAQSYVLGTDFDTVWAGKTGAQFDAVWATDLFDGNDFEVTPLWH